jgi:hypothetical protein
VQPSEQEQLQVGQDFEIKVIKRKEIEKGTVAKQTKRQRAQREKMLAIKISR